MPTDSLANEFQRPPEADNQMDMVKLTEESKDVLRVISPLPDEVRQETKLKIEGLNREDSSGTRNNVLPAASSKSGSQSAINVFNSTPRSLSPKAKSNKGDRPSVPPHNEEKSEKISSECQTENQCVEKAAYDDVSIFV